MNWPRALMESLEQVTAAVSTRLDCKYYCERRGHRRDSRYRAVRTGVINSQIPMTFVPVHRFRHRLRHVGHAGYFGVLGRRIRRAKAGG
jgi:hypothetical protein